MRHLLLSAGALALGSLAQAQGPDIIHYTFDNGTAANSASGTVPAGIPDTGVGFGTGICGAGGAVVVTAGATCRIDTQWVTDFGTGDWTVGLRADRTNSPVGLTTLQYLFGNSSAGGFRCFVGGIAGTNGIVLRAPSNAVTIPGGGDLRPVHVVWCYDSVAGVVNGYLDGALVVTTPNAGVNISGTATMNVMQYTASSTMGAGYELDDFRVYRRCLSAAEVLAWFNDCGSGSIGTSYCSPAVANSTGSPASMGASGSNSVGSNNLVLEASSMPLNAFGFFLTSATQGLVANPGGSAGTLCLGGAIGRYVGPGQIRNSGATGAFSLAVNLTQHPTPSGPVSVSAGQTWNFQAWYRDAVGGVATSNFTDGYQIAFTN